jgi:hypothetical protein
MKIFKFLFPVYLIITSPLCAQDDSLKHIPVEGSLQLENMHLWRGQEVVDEFTLATEIYYTDKSRTFKFGLWGGSGLNGKFKEFDYYFNYSKSGLTFAIWDIYNFSPNAEYNNKQFFNYNARETGRFIDASLSYRFQDNFPVKLFWATILFGRDRGALNERNRYSTYTEVSFPVLSQGMNIDIGIGGAFALRRERDLNGKKLNSHFYGNTPGIININLQASRQLDLLGYKLPVSLFAMWNPESNYANLEIALNLISF